MAFDENLFQKYSIDELKVATDNSTVYLKRYWIVHQGSVLRFKKTNAWQCNSLKTLLDEMVKNNPIFEDCEVVFFDYLYVPK